MSEIIWFTTREKADQMGISPERVCMLIPLWESKWARKVYRPSKVYIGRVSKKYTWEIRADAPDPRKAHGRPRKEER